ncbi:hypothetical protein [Pseudomonas sp.]|uniref:hypothetical protein n=1 Tax=Pseudomonas sp. TaxID=306 RepID=UPI003D6F0233
MQGFPLRLCAMLLCCLLSAKGWALSAPLGPVAMTGPEILSALNQRLASTPVRCLDSQPDYACSGVLVRPMTDAHPQPFWMHDQGASDRGSERFVFLRKDGMAAPEDTHTGYVLMDHFAALATGKPYQVTGRTNSGSEVYVSNWNTSQPQALAVQALYYRVGAPSALFRAQRGQLEWFKATGKWLPVLRFEPGNGSGAFGFDQREQMYNGYQIASDINARFATTPATCPDGRARYYCQGVLVRTTNVGNFKAWNPSPVSERNQAVSFSYFAADAALNITVWPQGYVVFPSNRAVNQPLEMRCIYPFDGGTSITNQSCAHRGVCADLGISDRETWLARNPNTRPHSCAFGTDPVAFLTAVHAHQWGLDLPPVKGATVGVGWNEPVMRTWPQDKPAQLPLEAFFYSLNVHYPPAAQPMPAYGLSNAKRFQQQYVEETRRYLPVLRLDPRAPGGQLVTFNPFEQFVQ